MSKNRKAKQRFIGIPLVAYNSPGFAQLSFAASRLLIDIASQYHGKNNGDLGCSWQSMRRKGWRSRTTLKKAKAELLQAGFIETTRKGGFHNGPSLYALCWSPIDEKDKGWPLEVQPTKTPSLRFIVRKAAVNE